MSPPPEYVKAKKKAKKSGDTVPEPDGLDWAYVIDNENLRLITKTTNISSFCKIQHLKYIAHITRLENDALQKQLLFKLEHTKYSRDPWIKMEKDLNISKEQIQKTMQNKQEFMSLLHQVYN
jgi:hypothetical protein